MRANIPPLTLIKKHAMRFDLTMQYIPSLKDQHFDRIKTLHQELKSFQSAIRATIKHNFFATRFANGLTKVIRYIWRVLEYTATDSTFRELISEAIRLFNILINRLGQAVIGASNVLESARHLYGTLTSLLDRDTQLSLFEAGDDFGWYLPSGLTEQPMIENVRKALLTWHNQEQESDPITRFFKRRAKKGAKPHTQLALFDTLLYA